MKKLLLLFIVLVAAFQLAQAQLPYSQGFGTGTTLPTGWAFGGANAATNMSVTANTTGPYTSNYICASGGSTVEDGAGTPPTGASVATLTSAGISTVGATNITILWGARYSSAYTGVITVAWGTNGSTYPNTISYTDLARGATIAGLINSGVPISLGAGAAGTTIYLQFTFTRSNKSGNGEIDDITIAGTPVQTIDESGVTQTTAANINQGSNGNILSTFHINDAEGSDELTQLSFPLTGSSFSTGDFTNFHLLAGTTSTFSSATTLSTVSGAGISGTSTLTFASLTENLNSCNTNTTPNTYFWITGDVSATATVNDYIIIPALANSDFTFAVANTPTNSETVGGTQTIYALAANPTMTLDQVGQAQQSAGTITEGVNGNIVSDFHLSSGNAAAGGTLGSISFTAGGTFIAGDITNFHLLAGTTSTFSSATNISTVSATGIANTGTVTFSSLAYSIAANSNYYFWITADVSATGTVNNTVKVPATPTVTITLGTLGTNSITAGGTQTIIAPAYYWNGGAIASTPAAGGTGTWGTALSWRQPSSTGAQATWVDGNTAILGGTAGTITLAANVSTPLITTQITAYVLAGASTLNLTGATPTLNSTGKLEFDNPVAAINQIVISNTGSTINFGSTSGTANTNSGSNTLTGGFYIPSTATGVRVNGNQPNAFGTSGNAGTILIDATGTILSCVSGVGNTLGNTVYNAISLNPSGNTPFGVAIGATKGGSAGVPSFPVTYAGEISEGGSGTSSIYTGNTTAAGGGGASGTIFTYSYTPGTGYLGSTVICGSQNSYFQCGANNCLPQATDLVYGNTGSGYGIIDLNGKSVTVGTLSSNIAAGTNFGITNNNGAGTGTLTLNGDGNAPGYNLFAAVIGTNSTFTDFGYLGNTAGTGSLLGSNNIALVLTTNYQDTLKLTAVNTFTGGLTINGGELQLGVASALASTLNVSLGGGTLATGDAYNSGGGGVTGFSNTLGTVNVTAPSYITLGGVTNTLTLANITGVTATNTLTINNWSGSAGTAGTVGHIIVTSGSLSQTELNNITFTGFGSGAQLIGGNELVPYSPNLNASVSVLPNTGSEGAGTAYVITFSVAPGTVTANSTVDYVLSGTNVTSSRFVGSPSLSGSATILSGNSQVQVTYTVYNDNIFEGPTTVTVTMSKPATGYGSLATASGSTSFTIADDATFYWNGNNGSPTANGPSLGGGGTWDATNTWIAPINTIAGTEETWVDGLYNAEFDGTAGTVIVDNAFNATLATFNTTGYTIQTNSANEYTITTGNIVLGNNVNLNVSVDNGTGSGRLDIYGATGTGTASLTLEGGTAGNERIGLLGSTPTIAVTTYITGTGTGYVGYNTLNSGTNATISGNIVNNSTEATALGGTATSTIDLTGSISGTAGVTFQNGASGGGAHITLGAANFYGGSTTMNGASSMNLILDAAGALPSGTALIFAAAEGGILDLHGYSATISSITSGAAAAGSITNSATGAQTSTLTIAQNSNSTFALAINDGAASQTALVFSGTGTLTLGATSSFSGGLTISSGEVALGGANLLSSNLPVTLSGGELKSGGNSQTFASLLLTANSTIAVGGGTPTITFTNASGWTGGTTLTVNGWTGTAGVSGTAGKLFFTSSLGALVNQISFPGYSGAMQLGTGEVVPATAVTKFWAVGTGVAETDAIWSTTSNGTGVSIASLGGFVNTVDVEIQNGFTVTTSTGGIVANNLIVDAGGTLKSTNIAGVPVTIGVYGNLTNSGTIGNGATTELGIDFEGVSPTISGTTFDLVRIRKNDNTNTTTTLTINANINIWQQTAAGLYNAYAGNTNFNVIVGAGYTLNFEGSADLAIDGPTGTASEERKGTITINGIITGVDTVFATTNNTGGTTGITVASGGILTANSYIVNLLTGLSNNFQLNIQSGGTMNVNNYLGLVSGTFSPVGLVHFRSASPTQCAVLDNFSSGFTGTLSGSVEADRNYNAASAGLANNQHFLGSPVDAPAFSQLGASGTAGYIIPTSPTSADPCDQLQSASNSPYGNVFSYNEAAAGTNICSLAGWDVITSGNAVDGEGYSYLTVGTGTLSLTGQPNLNGNYTFNNLTNHGWSNTTYQGNVVTGGWWLMSNPYLASLTPSSNGTGIDGQVQVWVEDGGNAGTYQSAIAGEGAIVAPFQAYMVHVTNPGGNTATESTPTTGNVVISAGDRTISQTTQFYRTVNQSELKITALNTGTGLTDNTTVAFNPDATLNFDPTMDANKLAGAVSRHTIYSVEADGQLMSINTLPSLTTSTVEVPVNFKPGVSGNYTFSFAGLTSFDATTVIMLQDKLTNTMYNVKNGDYKFTANSTDNWSRFTLIFNPIASTTGITTVSDDNTIPVWSYQNKVNVDFSQLKDVKATVTIYNVLGQEIASENYEGNAIYTKTLDNIDAAFMIVRVVNGDQIVTKKVFITNTK